MKPFLKDLQYGNAGLDVYRLQSFLQSQGLGTFVPTGFFGQKTLDAVKAFQTKYVINPVAGYFGPISRAKANAIISIMNREKIYQTAVSCLNRDASPNDLAPDEYGCAETVSDVLILAGFWSKVYLSTTDLYHALVASTDFTEVYSPLPGDIIISPTGFGNGNLSNGHTGIVGEGGAIMSNSSATGNFIYNYTLDSWKARYEKLGGFPIYYFRKD